MCEGFYQRTVAKNEKLQSGQVWCHACYKTIVVDSARCLQKGWPKCCGETMSLDIPVNRKCKESVEGSD